MGHFARTTEEPATVDSRLIFIACMTMIRRGGFAVLRHCIAFFFLPSPVLPPLAAIPSAQVPNQLETPDQIALDSGEIER
jgi:hypothetical protein